MLRRLEWPSTLSSRKVFGGHELSSRGWVKTWVVRREWVRLWGGRDPAHGSGSEDTPPAEAQDELHVNVVRARKQRERRFRRSSLSRRLSFYVCFNRKKEVRTR